MTRFANNKNKSIEPVLAAAERWKRDCLLGGGSVFQPELRLWTAENMSELGRRLSSANTESNKGIADGLEELLALASPEVKKLAAEFYWVLYLVPYRVPTAANKRDTVQRIWSQSGDSLSPDNPHLTDELLGGVGGPLRAFFTYRWQELQYFAAVCKEILALPRGDRENLLSDVSAYSKKLTEIPGGQQRQSRHMLVFALFPEERERVFSGSNRRHIVKSFNPDIPYQKIKEMPAHELDQLLFDTRRRLEGERGIAGLDWYDNKAIAKEWGWRQKSENVDMSSRQGYVIGIRRTSKAPFVYLRAVLACDVDGNPVRTESLGRRPTARDFDPEREYLVPIPDGDPAAAVEAYRKKHGDSSDKPYFFSDSGGRGIEVANEKIGLSLVDPRWSQSSTEATMKVAGEANLTGKSVAELSGIAKNVILYGPPGTGKTYKLNQLREEYVSKAVEVSEKDRWESLAEVLVWWQAIAVVLEEAGGEVSLPDLKKHPLMQIKGRSLPTKARLGHHISSYAWHHSDRSEKPAPPVIFESVRRATWKLVDNWQDLAPDLPELLAQSIGKPEIIKGTPRYAYVTFHQSYSYEDFVEGIRPTQDDDSEEVVYRVELGAFRRICARAKNDPERRYAMFIDEINRGNISKIFGELITLLEPDKRARYDEDGNCIGGMELTLPYSGDSFGVPENLDMYGAMNTADRSIALLDTALRRRFEFEELMPDADIIPGADGAGNIEDGEGGSIDLRQLLESMNRRIRFLLDREHMIGHSYFMDIGVFADLRRVLARKVLPLLQEYFYEDWSRIQLVLRDRIGEDRNSPQIIRDEPVEEMQVLGFDHDDYEDKVEYEKVAESEITPAAVRKIYET